MVKWVTFFTDSLFSNSRTVIMTSEPLCCSELHLSLSHLAFRAMFLFLFVITNYFPGMNIQKSCEKNLFRKCEMRIWQLKMSHGSFFLLCSFFTYLLRLQPVLRVRTLDFSVTSSLWRLSGSTSKWKIKKLHFTHSLYVVIHVDWRWGFSWFVCFSVSFVKTKSPLYTGSSGLKTAFRMYCKKSSDRFGFCIFFKGIPFESYSPPLSYDTCFTLWQPSESYDANVLHFVLHTSPLIWASSDSFRIRSDKRCLR